ncbi:MAG: NADH:ubiquinone reductase (Na(+)-transporting) subunit C [Paludibacter sp.]|nr:NADH:ubiquinone reductase (Na(+)-transporting) subunit C [Paludibacter sp.]MBP8783555.1 NADH:ubiquinone reductase (Na(+)-transporting) subunit C [Paludibacter sp.]
MNTNKNSYTLIYAVVMVVVVALLLALVSSGLKDIQNNNVKLDKKKQILSSLNIQLDGQDANTLYEQHIVKELVLNIKGEVVSEKMGEAFVIDVIKENAKAEAERQLPLYVAEVDGQTKYIITMRGAGLWGPIWGYIALNDDKNTVFGTYFSHASETPGLGAEIALPAFQNKFVGKHILNDARDFVSIAVMKPGQTAEGQDYVDGISGGTITSKGVEAMLLKSIGQYEAYLKN